MPQARGRPTAAARAARRSRVLRIAAAMLLEHGTAGASLDRLASEAGVSKRTLYSDYGGKSGLLRAVVRELHDYRGDAGLDLVGACRAIVRTVLADDAVALHRLVVAEGVSDPQLSREFYEAGPASAQRFLADRLPAAQQDQAPELYTLLLGEAHRRRLLGLDPAPSPSSCDALADRALAVLLG